MLEWGLASVISRQTRQVEELRQSVHASRTKQAVGD